MVIVHEDERGQKRITLRQWFCEALGIKGGDEVSIIYVDMCPHHKIEDNEVKCCVNGSLRTWIFKKTKD